MCVSPDDLKLKTFNGLRKIVGGVSLVTQSIRIEIERSFPDLMAIVSEPQRWIAGLPPWLAQGASLVEARSISVDVVEAPLDWGASHVSVNCPRGGPASNIFVINASFLAAARHVLSTSHGNGLSVETLRGLLCDLRADAKRLSRGPHGESTPFSIVVPGVAWILAHELAHATGGEVVSRDAFKDIPDWCRDDVSAEINADISAVRMLLHRIQATPYAGDRSARLNALFNGLELYLRGSALIDALRRRQHIPFDQYPPVHANGGPTSALRWQFISAERDFLRRLGLLEESLGPGETLFANWDQTVRGLIGEQGDVK